MNERIFLLQSDIQKTLDKHYRHLDKYLSLDEAMLLLINQGIIYKDMDNTTTINSLYPINDATFMDRLGDIYLYANPDELRHFKGDRSHFFNDRAEVFLQSSFHHVRPEEHCHENIEVTYVYRGQYRFTSQGKEHIMSRGDAVLLSPNTAHTIEEFSDDSFYITLYINKSNLSLTFRSILKTHNIISEFIKEIISNPDSPNYLLISTDNNPVLNQLMINLFIEQVRFDQYAPECTLNYLKLFFLALIRSYDHFDQFYVSGANVDIGPVLDYLSKHYKTSTLSEMAKHFNYSNSYLSTLIKNSTGKNYTQIIKQYRLSEAKDYLDHSNRSVKDIALECGYNDVDHFSKTFKKVYGMSPQQYRSLKKKDIY